MKSSLSFLLADDDPDDLSLFESLLRQEAPEAIITCVKDGTEVISYLKTCPGALPAYRAHS